MRSGIRKSVLARTILSAAVGAAYGALLARYVSPRMLGPGALSQENMILAALKYSPLVGALAKVFVASIVALHCGLLRTSSRKRTTREKVLATTASFGASLGATLFVMKFLK